MKSKGIDRKVRIECPKCRVYMRREEVEVPGPNIVIDHCPQCGSYWFDKGELNKYVRDRKPDRFLRKSEGLSTWGKDKCPRCGGTISVKFLKGIELDHCEECGGLWLDHGELKHIEQEDMSDLKEKRLGNLLSKLKHKDFRG